MITPGLSPLAVPLDDTLVLDPSNARKHGPENIQAIKDSLAAYGQHRPAVAQRREDGTLLVRIGNGMIEAARDLGWDEVAVLVVDEDDVTAIGRGIADNRTAELAHWDNATLAALLRELPDEAATGFSATQAEALISLYDPESEDITDPEAEWRAMPEFSHVDLTAYRRIVVHFKSEEDIAEFARRIDQVIGEKTRSIWFPPDEIGVTAGKAYGVPEDEEED